MKNIFLYSIVSSLIISSLYSCSNDLNEIESSKQIQSKTTSISDSIQYNSTNFINGRQGEKRIFEKDSFGGSHRERQKVSIKSIDPEKIRPPER